LSASPRLRDVPKLVRNAAAALVACAAAFTALGACDPFESVQAIDAGTRGDSAAEATSSGDGGENDGGRVFVCRSRQSGAFPTFEACASSANGSANSCGQVDKVSAPAGSACVQSRSFCACVYSTTAAAFALELAECECAAR
jgi:hypothetical protein